MTSSCCCPMTHSITCDRIECRWIASGLQILRSVAWYLKYDRNWICMSFYQECLLFISLISDHLTMFTLAWNARWNISKLLKHANEDSERKHVCLSSSVLWNTEHALHTGLKKRLFPYGKYISQYITNMLLTYTNISAIFWYFCLNWIINLCKGACVICYEDCIWGKRTIYSGYIGMDATRICEHGFQEHLGKCSGKWRYA